MFQGRASLAFFTSTEAVLPQHTVWHALVTLEDEQSNSPWTEPWLYTSQLVLPILLVLATKRQSSNRRLAPLFFNPSSVNMQRPIENERVVFLLLSRRMFSNKSIRCSQVRFNRMFVMEERMESSDLWRGCRMS